MDRRKLSLEELGRIDVEAFKKQQKNEIILVADNIRSALNIGSLFRTADAFNLEELVCVGISATPPHKEINKTAIGATHSVEWSYTEDVLSYLHSKKEEGYKVLSVEQTTESKLLTDVDSSIGEKLVVVMGNEVSGVQQSVIDVSDEVIEIAQYGTKHSLNVTVCAGIVLWHLTSMKYIR